MTAAVFLDRDGTLNRAVVRAGKPYPPASLAELEILPGAEEACRALKAAGYLLIGATNQPDVAKGLQTRAMVETINAEMSRRLGLDGMMVCYHDDRDACACRKPRPGMLLEAAERHGIDLARSYMIGDRWRDVACGQAAGCACFFIDEGYEETRPSPPYTPVASVREAADRILGRRVAA
ncbi:MAG: HAD family hydrolase [Alphaproteobacteria bacterium]|nr:HAD family hydrolase [Alphaproteobacteria bacterium]